MTIYYMVMYSQHKKLFFLVQRQRHTTRLTKLELRMSKWRKNCSKKCIVRMKRNIPPFRNVYLFLLPWLCVKRNHSSVNMEVRNFGLNTIIQSSPSINKSGEANFCLLIKTGLFIRDINSQRCLVRPDTHIENLQLSEMSMPLTLKLPTECINCHQYWHLTLVQNLFISI